MRGVFGQMSKSLPSDTSRQKFMESISQSKDIYELLIETTIIDKIDKIGGPIKLALTIAGKYMESSL